LNAICRQIDDAVDNVDEHAAITNRARSAAEDRAEIYGRLSAELARRTAATDQPARTNASPPSTIDRTAQAASIRQDESPAASVSVNAPMRARAVLTAVRQQQLRLGSDSPAASDVIFDG
jgi:hypothetical protein